MNNPQEVITIVNKLALKKGSYQANKTLMLAFLAGAYIAFGGLLAIIVGGGSPGIAAENPGITKFLFGATFPIGLILVVVVGAELFTGNNAYFVAMGFEHSIANMFFIPLAIFEGAQITWETFVIKNLIPATLGNIVGGVVFVGMFYGYLFGREK